MQFLDVLSLFVFVEEDGDEIKIGTSCKNGGCTKVSECVTGKLGRHSGLNSHAVEMYKNLHLNPNICRALETTAGKCCSSTPNLTHIFENLLKYEQMSLKENKNKSR